MSVKAYVGRMGSGKTFEVVKEVMCPALARGVRVVTNIAGIQFDKIQDLLESEGVALEDIGELIHVDHEDVLKDEFWRTDRDAEEGRETTIQPGDLILLDEIWRFWDGFAKPPERVMNFFRMHRHFADADTGVTCNVGIITQDVADIGRKIRAVIEETYRMQKHTAIGSSKLYRVDIYAGGSCVKSKLLKQLQRKYDPRYFVLYSSHSQRKEGDAAPVEQNIDDRGNILKGALFKLILPVALLFIILSVWWLWRFLHPVPKDETKKIESKQGTELSQAKLMSPPETGEWRVAGLMQEGRQIFVFLSDGLRSRVLINPPGLKVTAFSAEVLLPSGEVATSWGGSKSAGLIDKAAGGKP